ncbi:MAG: RluA family pseudouridine synthase [Christensenellales bacterium]
MKRRLKITPEHGEKRLDIIVAEFLGVSRAQAQSLIKNGSILISGRPAKANHRPKPGDILTAELPSPSPLDTSPQDIDINIIYEDDDIAVVNKPRGLVVHPAAGHADGTLVNALLFRLNSLSSVGGEERRGIVHRLDRDTSGLMIIAKNDASHTNLSKALKNRAIIKTYYALTDGVPNPAAGRISQPIARHPRDRKKMAVIAGGREAISDYEVLEDYKDTALVKICIPTGRTHQIRVHMAYINTPIIGDPVYGRKKQKYNISGQALHAAALDFEHPSDGRQMSFFAPPPHDMQRIIDILGNK